MDGTVDVTGAGTPNSGEEPPPESESVHPTPEDLVAKAIAPVKAEYLLPPPLKRTQSAAGVETADDASERKGAAGVVKMKKSKRQLKRERRQEQKSALNICPEVAKQGKADACQYGAICRFSHDLDSFLAQKPADLEGSCPFLNVEESCPYGIGCRFSNTHKQQVLSESGKPCRSRHETNNLNKDLQKLLWKNKVSFPRANGQLKLLGLKILGGKNAEAKSGIDQVESHEAKMNGSDDLRMDDCSAMENISVNEMECATGACIEKDCLEDPSNKEESRPLKKVKCPADEQCSSAQTNNGTCTMENTEEFIAEKGNKEILDDSLCSSGIDLTSEPHSREKKLIDFRGKLYLAPLTTVGNLPFRRVCKALGADITCGEMAMCTNILQGQASEWALLRRHSSEDIFGVQICGSYPDTVARTVELIDRECKVDFIDINMGCPIDIVVNKGAGSSLLTKPMRMKGIIQAASGTIDKPITVKVRTGYFEGRNRVDSLIADISDWGASAVTVHGRSRQQRYSKLADWDYIDQCATKAPNVLQVLGNGDIFSYSDWNKHTSECSGLSTCMIARGALIKPWIFTEIKEQRHWDITSSERFNFLKDFVNYGLQHWGSDAKGVETTRHFLLEWLSYTYRYIPVGLLDVIPQKLNWRPPTYFGRDDLETLMASDSAADWVRISEMLLGNVPEGFTFAPKHKSNAYDRAENG
ncbi:tRNA-dihydrouridine(47) synthase [NAD(P)(+)]-like isoform X3 [Iris pallida]|uniref:tRNA-dihydrouridine(47) synthase [NAD(P)(+)] n=1 Tax=Iris pallida TaxID=29817 RepID=A0AAX6I8K9_IRIPA|nr:tRNA-dihydrouridine(47) synthase [NAD(P)(+)]-like isoform X3 [Iris pallida]